MTTNRLLLRMIVPVTLVMTLGLLYSTPSQANLASYAPAQPGFPQELTGGSIRNSSPMLADLDGVPSTLEIVVAGRDQTDGVPNCLGRVYAYRPDGTKYWETQVRAPIESTPAIADIDQDGILDVVVGLGGYVETSCWDGGVIALDGRTGDIKWTFDTQDHHNKDGWLDDVYSSPAVGDVDNDGDLEIAFGSWDECIYLLDAADGTPVWPMLNLPHDKTRCGGHGFYNEDTIWSSPAMFDLDGDGTLEIITGADITAGNQNGDPSGGYVYVLRHDGEVLAREWLDQAIFSTPAIGDLDNDGQYEIAIGSGTYYQGTGYYVKVFNYDPSADDVTDRLVQKWHWATSGRVFSSPALADLNGDSYLDVIVASRIGDGPEQGGGHTGGKIFAWNGYTGAKLFETLVCNSLGDSGEAITSSPTVAEVGRASDTGLKILFTRSPEVAILNADGTYYTDAGSCFDNETTDISYWANYLVLASPAVGDIDSDGLVEVVIGGAYDHTQPNIGRLYAWEPGRAVGELPWPMFRHDTWHHGVYGFVPDVTPPTNPTSLVAIPNPSTWSNDNTVQTTWSGASDDESGIGSYYYVWDTSADTIPGPSDDFVSAEITSTTSTPLNDGDSWYFHVRARDQAENWADGAVHIGPFWIDTIAPTAIASSPAFTIPASFPVSWNGSDTASGVASYDVQVQVDDGTWQDWLADATQTTDTYTGTAGHTYCFRARAEDIAGNVADYASGNGDTCTTVTNYELAGTIWNNRDQPIYMARVSATPAMSNTAYSELDGTYTLFFNLQGTYTLEITRTSFGPLPSVTYTLAESLTNVDFILPPQNNIIVNGDFERGLEGWDVSGPGVHVMGTLQVTTTAHTGQGALDFTNTAAVTQTVALSSTTTDPTLSLLYRVIGTAQPSDAVTVTARSASQTVSMTLSLDEADWTHAWLDVGDLAGQSISVTLKSAIAPQSPAVHVIVDEISLGTSLPGVYHVMLPLIFRQR